MGDIKKQKKKYKRPTHPWQKARIEEERTIKRDYGLKNKKEIWRFGSILKNFKSQAKSLITSDNEKQKEQLLGRIHRLGILPQSNQSLDAILALSLQDILDRRLQTQVVQRGLARSAKQARQFITHGHIIVGGRKVTAPSYLVPVSEQESIAFANSSALHDEEHPERALPQPAEPVAPAEEKAEEPKEEAETKEEKK